MAAHPACAAKLLIRLTGGDPEAFLGYETTKETPRTNTRALLEELLDTLTATIVKALDEEDDATYAAATRDRIALILVYAIRRGCLAAHRHTRLRRGSGGG